MAVQALIVGDGGPQDGQGPSAEGGRVDAVWVLGSGAALVYVESYWTACEQLC